jgi:hypothetical protein
MQIKTWILDDDLKNTTMLSGLEALKAMVMKISLQEDRTLHWYVWKTQFMADRTKRYAKQRMRCEWVLILLKSYCLLPLSRTKVRKWRPQLVNWQTPVTWADNVGHTVHVRIPLFSCRYLECKVPMKHVSAHLYTCYALLLPFQIYLVDGAKMWDIETRRRDRIKWSQSASASVGSDSLCASPFVLSIRCTN